jgi:transposase InsO family protein
MALGTSRIEDHLDQARSMVQQSVTIYCAERPHLSLQYKIPDEVHRVLNP